MLLLPCLAESGKARGRNTYIFTPLPGRCAVKINDQGIVIMRNYGDGRRGVVWIPETPNGTKGKYYTLSSDIFGINNNGDIIGISHGSFMRDKNSRAFRIKAGLPFSKAIYLDKGFYTTPHAINNNGVIIGNLTTPGTRVGNTIFNGSTQAIKWTSNSNYSNLGRAEWGARDINDKGTIIGVAYDRACDHACIFSGNRVINLGFGKAYAINNQDVIVGMHNDRACKWINRKPIFLDKELPGCKLRVGSFHSSTAQDINDKNQVVGDVLYEDMGDELHYFEREAVIWQNGKRVSLKKLVRLPKGWKCLIEAVGINNKGQIIGNAQCTTPNKFPGTKSYQHAFLLTPAAK